MSVEPRPGRSPSRVLLRGRGAAVSDRRCAGRQGLALLLSLIAIFLIGVLVVGGHLIAARQYRGVQARSQAAAALYAAEAGLHVSVAGSATAFEALGPGESTEPRSGQLEGAAYRASVARLDGGEDDRVRYFLATSVGRSLGPRGGRRQLGLLLRVRRHDALCCRAALRVRGELQLLDRAVVDGRDRVPAVWERAGAVCVDSVTRSLAAIQTDDAGQAHVDAGSLVEGTPPIAEAEVGDDLVGETDRWLSELAEQADVVFSGDAQLERVAAARAADGSCARARRGNWGAPRLPDHPCFSYLPIVHVQGDLTLGSGRGQGILLVEGDLAVGDDFEFYGVVLVRGRLTASGARFYGGAIAVNVGSGSLIVRDGAAFRYSGCAVRRAFQGSKLQVPRPLAEFAWLEILQ